MYRKIYIFGFAFLICVASALVAVPPNPEAPVRLISGLGEVHHPVSTKNKEAQQFFAADKETAIKVVLLQHAGKLSGDVLAKIIGTTRNQRRGKSVNQSVWHGKPQVRRLNHHAKAPNRGPQVLSFEF